MAKRAASQQDPDLEALFCALVLAPGTFPRNRFYALYEKPGARRARRRAGRLRSIVRQLLRTGENRAEITGEQELDDGRVLIRYRVERLGLKRTAALSPLEAAVLRYALNRAQDRPIAPADRRVVETALERLAAGSVEQLTGGAGAHTSKE